ncbi:hypothetical protein [Streptomyces sp. NPDC050355]|uniref:hypothetical protein n=1 Tax=Streptomyces TaxID=1883 RepID=UPI0037A7BB32
MNANVTQEPSTKPTSCVPCRTSVRLRSQETCRRSTRHAYSTASAPALGSRLLAASRTRTTWRRWSVTSSTDR